MKYKGYLLTAYYTAGSNIRELKNGIFVKAIPKPKDLDHIGTEHMVTGEQLPNSLSFKEAKEFINMYVKL
jgi:hypothetical protein